MYAGKRWILPVGWQTHSQEFVPEVGRLWVNHKLANDCMRCTNKTTASKTGQFGALVVFSKHHHFFFLVIKPIKNLRS